MRELERSSDTCTGSSPITGRRLAIIGRGRLAGAVVDALRTASLPVSEPLGHRPDLTGYGAVLLCVPDAAIAAAAAAVPAGPLVGHCSGATGLDALAPHEGFSLHPLMSFPSGSGGDRFAGAGAAVAGTTPRALDYAHALAAALGTEPFTLAEEDRAAYHAAASVASNFLVTLEAGAERIAAGTGLRREHLVALVRATVENWAELGPEGALTGPIARGDDATVAAQRAAIAERATELVELFDVLAAATRELMTPPAVAA